MDQIRRASLSVILNISEGFERKTNKDFAKFINQAKASAGEIRCALYIALDLEYILKEQFDKMKAADARATQVTNTTTFLGMEKAHANALRKAPLKTRNELDNLLTKEETRVRLAAEGTLLEAKQAKLKADVKDPTKAGERNELRQKLNQTTRDLNRFNGITDTIANSREFLTGGEGTGEYAAEADDKKAETPAAATPSPTPKAT